MRFLVCLIVLCMCFSLVSLATSSSETYTVQTQTTSGGDNPSSATYQQTLVVGIIGGLLNSSTYLNNVGFLHTVRLANGVGCTEHTQCEGEYCCSNTCSSSTCGNETEEEPPEEEPTPGSGGGSSGGGGSGGGSGGISNLSSFYTKKQAETNFTISPEILRFHLILGESNTSEVFVENTGKLALNATLNVEEIEEYLTLSSLLVADLPIGETDAVMATAEGKRFGSHFGEIVAASNGINRTSDVIIEVESEALFDVRLDIVQALKYLSSNEKPRAQITMFNLGSTPASTTVTYLIKDAKGTTYSEETEEFFVERELSYAHEFKTPNLPNGKYLAVIEVRYADSFAVSSDIFSVVDKDTFTLIAPIAGRNITFFISLLVLSGIAYIAISYFMPSRPAGRKNKPKK
jgi:hypothetical protein